MEFSPPNQSIGYKYSPIFRQISTLFANQLKPFGITPEQWTVLYQVHLDEGINQKEIAIRTNKDQPTVTRILDVLDKKQLIIRQIDTLDRRAFLIYATPSAHTLINDTLPLELRLNDTVTAGITDQQLHDLQQIMQQIQHNINQAHQE
ncbi:hypothetical protein PNBC_01290 [Paenibacillus crassostreae]|uniref:HTH marR-type domain-containing protein n=1 Tax=Paenibacillus crassostreae TaxID=1763538 RepID=A0A167GML8_9BACL|nr:hypothetical protein LPB68_08210 [Paenibacillus crassostreae]OAB77719.1 hypothetical protein PNBC_01290 [Paenibacillus crassostreae]